GNWAENNIIKLTVPILILGVPIFDMVFTTIMRIKEQKINTIIERVATEGNYDFIFNSAGLAYAKKDFDVTQKVLNILESQ
ncbi:MAG: OmpH family outer membrane protein, partial [candidate division Zixibacteria bacterium]|nr:OmpH family outer membrane protein [candidate division Zixibacteria bacterium]